jgi:hypothetical protein
MENRQMRQAANSLSRTGKSPGLRCTNACPGQDFFLRAHDSHMKAAKNASLTRDRWFYASPRSPFYRFCGGFLQCAAFPIVFPVKIHNIP